jgi:uncharacterized protein (TIGR02099 family)
MLIVVAMGVSLVRLFPSAIEFYKHDLETKIFELTSIPVKIGKLKANLRGINPEIILKDIQVLSLDKQGNPSIELEQVRVGIDLTQLLSTHRLLPSSWLTLVGAKLSIVRNMDGKISIVGLNSDNSGQPLWLLSGGRYEVLKSKISWQDKKKQTSPVIFNDVDLLIRNDADAKTHELHLLTQLPEQYGEKLRISLSIQDNVSDLENITGWIYVEGNDVYLSEVLKKETFLGIKIADLQQAEENNSSFKIWSEWDKSSLKSLSGSIQADNFSLKKNKKTLAVNLLDTEFDLSFNDAEWKFGVKNFALTTDNYEWPLMEFSASANQQLTHLAASVMRVDLKALTALADFFVPLDKKNQTLVSNLGIKGQLKDFSIFVDRETNKYAVNGDFNNLYINAMSDFPQIKNLTGAVKGTDEGGRLRLFSENGSLFYPKLFSKAILLENISGSVNWRQLTDTWFVKTESLMLDNKDIETISKLSLTIPKNNGTVFMDLQTSFSKIKDIKSLANYFPVSMKKETVNWLKKVIAAGEIEKGNLLVYGNLNQFPFVDNSLGVFEVLFKTKNMALNYSPDWPNIKNMDANFLFAKNVLAVDVKKGNSDKLDITGASLNFPFFIEEPHIQIKSQIEGSISDVMSYLQQTPMQEAADKVINSTSPKGLTQIDLDLDVPVSENSKIKLEGIAHINNAELKINSIDLDITDIEGELKFSEKGLFADNLKAQSLGYPLSINANSTELKTAVTVIGEVDYVQLKKQFSFLDSDAIKNEQITGSSIYTVKMNLPKTVENKSADLTIKTNLVGMDVDLPGSLKKRAEQQAPLILTMPLNEELLLPVTINYKDELKTAININKQQSAIHSANIVYGKGETSILEKKGITIHINRDNFSGSEWMGLFKQESNIEIDTNNTKEDVKYPVLNHLALKTQKFNWQGKSLGPFEMILQKQEDKWQGNILSSFAKGAFVIPTDQKVENKIKLNMEYLNLTELMAIKMPASGHKTENVSVGYMPLIDVVSQRFFWKAVNLGRLEIVTEKLTEGIKFKRIKVTSKDYKMTVNGDWIKRGEGSVTNLHGVVNVKNFGKTLSKLDITDDVKETEGKLNFTASWQGVPYQFKLSRVDAEIDLDLNDGRISSIEPGFGRLLGLIAMEQWIKRLSLDFSDVFKAGLSFNKVTGHLKLREGMVKYKDLLVDAIPAHISLSGRISLLEKTLDQKVSVVPKSSAAIPIAGPIVEGIAGAITQVFDKDYKDGYFFGSKYEVNGKWNDLKVTPVQD